MRYNQIEPWFDNKEPDAIKQYFDSGGWLTEYKKTEELEQMIAKYVGMDYCIMMCNGTVTLFAALLAHEIGKGDAVLCPDYTMIATPNAIKLTGATPILVDIDKDSLCIDSLDMRNKMMRNAKALMLVSINGRYPENLDAILDYCYGEDIIVIEDAAQSLGSFCEGKHVGTFGSVGSFSFSMPKIISMGQGGCLVTNDPDVDRKLRMIKDFGRIKSGVDKHETMGWNFKYTDLQAVVGIEQMKKLPVRVEKKKKIYKWYQQHLKDVPGISFVETSDEVAPWFVDILVESRQELIDTLLERDIHTRPFYPAIHTQKPYENVKGKFPNSTRISEHGLWLPSSSFLTEDDVKYICEAFK